MTDQRHGRVRESGVSDLVGEDGRPLTANERKAITGLQALAKRWPRSLTLFSWSGNLVVFKSDEWAEHCAKGPANIGASDHIVARISGIPNDGGDP